MSFHLKTLFALIVLVSASNVMAVTRVVNSTANDASTIGTLPYWLLNGNDGDIIDCSAITGQTITLTSSLPAITKSYTINGAGITINGDNTYQAFQAASGTTSINNVIIQHALSKGGNGGSGYSGGGGAVGGGGALYVHGGATVTLTSASLLNNIAQGGNGGTADNNGNTGGGGGGGFGGGDGGSALTLVSTGGGGGGHSNGGNGGSNVSVNGSNGIFFGGGGGGAGINSVVSGGNGGNASPTGAFSGGSQSSGNGGGGAGDSQDGFSATGSGSSGLPGNGGLGIGADTFFGGGGGGGCSSETGFAGAVGLGAGGGGGGSNYAGGLGGILGGGGGGSGGTVGGAGGFGAGGGGASTGGIGGGSFGAGGGNGGSDPGGAAGGGGGGSGLGGAIFVQSNATLTIVDANQISGNSAIAGIGGGSTNASNPGYIPAGDGAALGQDIFVREQGAIIFNLNNSLTIATPIEGDQTSGPATTGGLQKLGTGVLHLNGANTYSGTTNIDAGILDLNGSVIGDAAVGAGGTLSGNATVSGNLTTTGKIHVDINGGSTSLVTVTGTAALANTLEVGIAANSQSKTYTVLTASAITGTFSNVTFTGVTPQSYSVSYVPAGAPTQVQLTVLKLNGNAVTGNGTIAGPSGAINFRLKAAYNSQNKIAADLFYNDAGGRVHFDNPVVTSLVFSGNQVTLGGSVNIRNQNVTFTVIVTGGNPGSFSISMSNGYSVSGNLTSGGITVQ